MHDHPDEAEARAIAALAPDERDRRIATLRRFRRAQDRAAYRACTRIAREEAAMESCRLRWLLNRVETLLGETSS